MDRLKLNNLNLARFEKFGQNLGKALKGDEVFELVSDLGGGKTTLVRAMANGANSVDDVSSPSFTICNEYTTSKFKIYHFDFYRLSDPGIIALELQEILNSNLKSVVIIEWPKSVSQVLPKDHLVISIQVTSQNNRDLEINYPIKFNYLFKGI